MRDLNPWFLILYVGVSILMMMAAVPLILGRVRPNLIFGVRTRKTLGDEEIWYQANAYGGRLFFGTGLIQLSAVVTLFCVPSLRRDVAGYNMACGTVMVGDSLLASVLLIRRIQSL